MSSEDYIDRQAVVRAAHGPRRKLHPYMAAIVSCLDRPLVHKGDLIESLQQERYLDPQSAEEVIELVESLGIIYRGADGYRLSKRQPFRLTDIP